MMYERENSSDTNAAVGGSSIADMIKRFREAKPTSRGEREEMKKNGNLSQLWWEREMPDENQDIPRNLAVGPQAKSMKPQRSSEILQPYNKPDDYITRNNPSDLLRGSIRSSLDQSFNLENLIEKEIKSLANEMKTKAKDISNRFSLESYNPDYTNRNQQFSSETSPTRYRIGNKSTEFQDPKISFLNQPIETLGSTGIKGLLVPDLKLDGKSTQQQTTDDKNSMKDLNVNLDELLDSLNEGKKQASYLPDGIEETIPQVTIKLHNQMLEFQNMFGNKYKEEDELQKEAKKRDETMKEEGRKEERTKKLLEIDPPSDQHPLEYFIDFKNNDNKVVYTFNYLITLYLLIIRPFPLS